MTPIEFLCILLDGPFIPYEERFTSNMILIEHYGKGYPLPPIREQLMLVS